MLSSTFNLERFVQAQEAVYDAACSELALGRKTTHWMWFVFPQLAQLGRSAIARHYGVQGRLEAAAYWAHPLLGSRLKHCTALVLAVPDKSAGEIFSAPDDLKLGSCMTLFEAVAPEEPVFAQVLTQYFDGQRDIHTVALLA